MLIKLKFLLTKLRTAQQKQFWGYEGINHDFRFGPDKSDLSIRPPSRDTNMDLSI